MLLIHYVNGSQKIPWGIILDIKSLMQSLKISYLTCIPSLWKNIWSLFFLSVTRMIPSVHSTPWYFPFPKESYTTIIFFNPSYEVSTSAYYPRELTTYKSAPHCLFSAVVFSRGSAEPTERVHVPFRQTTAERPIVSILNVPSTVSSAFQRLAFPFSMELLLLLLLLLRTTAWSVSSTHH